MNILLVILGFVSTCLIIGFIMRLSIYNEELLCFICRNHFNLFKLKRIRRDILGKLQIKFSFHDSCLKDFLLNPEKHKTSRIKLITKCIKEIEAIQNEKNGSVIERDYAIKEVQELSKKLIWSNITEGKPIEKFGENK